MSLRQDDGFRAEPAQGDAIRADAVETRTVSASPAAAPAQPMTPAVIAPSTGEARVKPRRTRNVVLATLLLAALGGGAYKAQAWWTVGRFFVSTDDAYVQADISVLAAKIPGYLAAVPVVNGQMMHRGDVIARIDDGDYRLAAQAAHDKLVTQQAAIARIARQVEAAQAQMLQASAQIDANRADAVRATADYARQQQTATGRTPP
jgi:membrane fusion protein (multidrug efflux system)